MAIKWRITVPKRIMEGGDTSMFVYEITAKDRARAIRRAREQAIENGDFPTGFDFNKDWRWQRMTVN